MKKDSQPIQDLNLHTTQTFAEYGITIVCPYAECGEKQKYFIGAKNIERKSQQIIKCKTCEELFVLKTKAIVEWQSLTVESPEDK